mgnify:CR=1 FL=1
MNPTNKMRWITRLVQIPTHGYSSIPYDNPFTGLYAPPFTGLYAPPVTMQVPVLQQWWAGINNNGDVIGEWIDVPVEVE